MLLGNGKIAFLTLAAVLVALSYYIYGGSLEGTLFLSGQALAGFSVLIFLACVSAKVKKRRMRVDIAFALTALFLVFINREEIFYAYDTERFRAEVRAKGVDNLAQVIHESTTELAAALRFAQNAGQETGAKFQAILSQIDDPLLYAPFSPQNISDLSVLTAAHGAATEKLPLIPGLLSQVDEHLAQERTRFAELVESLPRSVRDDLIGGFTKNREAERSFMARRIDQYHRFMILVSSWAEFFITRSGTFSQNENGALVFQSDADAKEYARHLSELDKLVAEEGALDAEIMAVNERRKDAFEKMNR